MLRLARRIVVVSTLLGFVPHPAAAQSSGAIPPPTTVILEVTVYDAHSGLPVSGAPVEVVGSRHTAVTDGRGVARFSEVKKNTIVRLWTTPAGYAPAAEDTRLGFEFNFASLPVVRSGAFTTGLIDPAAGGSFVFQGFVESGVPFHFEIDVPPGALNQWSSLHVSPFPTFAMFDMGIPSDRHLLGMGQILLKDAHGNSISETLAADVTVRMRPWTIDGGAPGDPSTIRIHRWNYGEKRFDEIGSPTAVDPERRLVEYRTRQFSIPSCSQASPRVGGAAPPPLSVEVTGKSCSTVVTIPIDCGVASAGGGAEIAQGTAITTSAGLKAAVEGTYGSEVGPAKAKISTALHVQLEASASGEWEASTSEKVFLTIEHGESVASNKCLSGEGDIVIIRSTVTVKAGPVSLGTITIPTAIRLVRNLAYDPQCPGCDGVAAPPLVDPDPCK